MTTNVMMRFLTRILNLFFYPATEWTKIAEENNNRKTVYVQFVLPLMCLMTIANIIGIWFNASRELFTVGLLVCEIAILWTSLGAGLYFSAFVITEIMAQQLGSKDHNRDFALIAYSLGAAYLVMIVVGLFPFFNEFLVLAFYSGYLYWLGIPHLIKVEGRQRMIYGLLSPVIFILTHSLAFFFFGRVLRALLLT